MSEEKVQDQELKAVEESSEVVEEQDDDSKVDETTKNDDEADSEPVKRPIYQMPVKKHQAEKEKWRAKEAEYKKQLAEMDAKLKSGSNMPDDEVKKFAEEQGLLPEAVTGLVELAGKKLSDKLAPNERIEKLLKSQEIAEAKTKVSSEFDDRVAQQIKQDYPSVTQEHLNKIKKEITELAFTNKYHRYDLVDIYLTNKNKFEFKDSHTAEGSSGRSAEVVNYNNVSDKDIENMSAKEYKKYSDFMAKKQGQWS